jgi:hypothetical protein
MRFVLLSILFAALTSAQEPPPDAPEVPRFGISVYLTGLTGQVYAIKKNAEELPNFKKLKPIGTIYTYSLAIPLRDFSEGFPGLPELIEWFAIDYTGRFWVQTPGKYRFLLTSDDGSRLYIDGKEVLDNDGVHAVATVEGDVKLKAGVHDIRVMYFQGPRYHVALMLDVVGPDGVRRRFNTEDFKPPAEDLEP